MNLVEDGTIEEQYRFKIRDCSLSVIILSCTVAESEYPRCGETFVDAVFDAERGVMTEVIEITRLCLLEVEVEVGIGIRDLYETQPISSNNQPSGFGRTTAGRIDEKVRFQRTYSSSDIGKISAEKR